MDRGDGWAMASSVSSRRSWRSSPGDLHRGLCRGPQDAHPGFMFGSASILAVLGLIGALIAKEDLGTAVSPIGTGLAMTYLAGARKRHLGIVGPGVCAGVRRIRRPEGIPRPTRARVRQSLGLLRRSGLPAGTLLVALGSGGLTGSRNRARTPEVSLPAGGAHRLHLRDGRRGDGGGVGVAADRLRVPRRARALDRASDEGSLRQPARRGPDEYAWRSGAVEYRGRHGLRPGDGSAAAVHQLRRLLLVFTMLAIGLILNVSQHRRRGKRSDADGRQRDGTGAGDAAHPGGDPAAATQRAPERGDLHGRRPMSGLMSEPGLWRTLPGRNLSEDALRDAGAPAADRDGRRGHTGTPLPGDQPGPRPGVRSRGVSGDARG